MYENIDTSSTVEIEHDPVIMTGTVLGLVALTGVGVWPFLRESSIFLLIGGALWTLCCAFLTLRWVARLLVVRGPVLTVSPNGVHDTRFSSDVLPWGDVCDVTVRTSTTSGVPAKTVELVVDRAALSALKPVPFYLRTGFPSGSFTNTGWAATLPISAFGLKASFYDIRNLLFAFAEAHAKLDPTNISSRRLARQF
ncbi:hypothetical protein LJR016_001804 [Devosia sp. LjRoot16]|uniref:hypothetical protein n=1 Tax=Devosia sp. LjRoot16 TaxID=3342271 RepID=UPI003ECEAA9D